MTLLFLHKKKKTSHLSRVAAFISPWRCAMINYMSGKHWTMKSPHFVSRKVIKKKQDKYTTGEKCTYYNLLFAGRRHAAVIKVVPLLVVFVLRVGCIWGWWCRRRGGDTDVLLRAGFHLTEEEQCVNDGRLTVASAHPTIVVGHGDEVVAARPRVWIDEELRHVQVSAGDKTSDRVKKPRLKQFESKIRAAMLSAGFKLASAQSGAEKRIWNWSLFLV